MLKGFRDFILRGNVVDLAVAFILGAAFTAVVTSFANDVLMQLVSAIIGKPDFKKSFSSSTTRPSASATSINAVVVSSSPPRALLRCCAARSILLQRIKKSEPAPPSLPPQKPAPSVSVRFLSLPPLRSLRPAAAELIRRLDFAVF